MGKINCLVCHRRCRGTVLKIDQEHVHKGCFKCSKCSKALEEAHFHMKDKNLYCQEDFRQEFSLKCSGCGMPLEGNVSTALGKSFHPNCLRCHVCRRLLHTGEKTVAQEDKFYCASCVPSTCLLAPLGGDVVPPDDFGGHNGDNFWHSADGKTIGSGDVPNFKTSTSCLGRTEKTTFLPPNSVNGTGELTVNVGEGDISIGYKKNDAGQSPTYSLYSREETALIKSSGLQSAATSANSAFRGFSLPASYATDGALTTPSMVQTLSGGTSTLFYGSSRRICPPGVDYGRQYPISYLRLAEQGLTAVTSTEELQSLQQQQQQGADHLPPGGSRYMRSEASKHRPRRDIDTPVGAFAQSRTLPLERPATADASYRLSRLDSRFSPQVFGEGGRPERDRYKRQRQLSPSSSSVGRSVGRNTLPGTNFISRRSHTYSSYSTPNVNSKRADSIMRTPREPRSCSPDTAALYQAEARRLAAYPSARIPDANSLPVIDRYDWPAPPSPAVVMIDRRRERASRRGLAGAGDTLDSTLPKSVGSQSDDQTLSPAHSPARSISPDKASEAARLEEKIATLKKATGNSGMSSAVVQYLQEKRKREDTPILDPVSASRSPNASREPPYGTRYSNHRFASPSRSTLRERPPYHPFNTGTVLSRTLASSPCSPRPGYTTGILSPRTNSLPRPQVDDSADLLSRGEEDGHASKMGPSQRRVMTHAPLTSTLPTDTSTSSVAGRQNDRYGCAPSGGTSSHFTDGFPATGFGYRNHSDAMQYRVRSSTLIGGLPPPSISGLRPVSRSPGYHLSSESGSRSMALNGGGRNRFPRTASEGRRTATAEITPTALSDMDFPTVQSWLRSPLPAGQQKTYSYEQLKVSSGARLKGINVDHRENHLSPEEFERLFEMTPAQFHRLPEWKQNDLKMRLDLY
uniref:Actin-binding LIM protein 1 n=1 Tax=Schistocephalus solidus TaxID=70667 RepID=A0A0X3PYU2_SCHSO